MIRTMAVTRSMELLFDLPLDELDQDHIEWYWVDFDCPTEEEALLLDRHFHFHPLAVEDCMHRLQRPKLDHYGDVHFFVLHSIHPSTLAAYEVDLFLAPKFLVSFHFTKLKEIDGAWRKFQQNAAYWDKGASFGAYLIMDKLVDDFFPSVHKLEDEMNEFDSDQKGNSIHTLMRRVFDIRTKLVQLRRTIVPMRDLLYRVLSSERIPHIKEQHVYFSDIHDHLLKLSEMIDSVRDTTADMRENFVSLNSYRMNNIMKTLTVITTIFMPLTFMAGIYGMNFDNMPELHWQSGYFIVLGVMLAVAAMMFYWFKRKGWFD
ncbi:magnesium/cobalt transporter CorA [Paenibacillus lutrae]|uniref:Magnesium transport protein CorA n=1 Tax=Paenibacillus lutrae TaxID=2078573 RepID=A0A7X3FJ02_9BACL|nr:magnesium/cobalt transporter CorA [Paenibacillus lutrae]MVP00540.1 magnesium/cobalt transporter CorA [Paenibacillus lutrae]